MPGAAPDIAVVIPTRNRAEVLERVLTGLAAQDLGGARAELVVVDNGSAPGQAAAIASMVTAHPWPARALRIDEANVCRARNVALEQVAAELVLLTNDDVLAADGNWVAGHLAAHRGVAAGELVAVLGPVEWAPEIETTRVMRWLSEGGHSHSYAGLEAGEQRPGELYANNLSLPAHAIAAAGGFDERLGGYGWEEYDLSLRLHAAGLVVHWHPELLAHHWHHYTLRQSLERMEAIGRASVAFNALHAAGAGTIAPRPSRLKVAAGRAIAPVATRIPVPDGLPDPVARPLLSLAHQAALARGFAAGKRAR